MSSGSLKLDAPESVSAVGASEGSEVSEASTVSKARGENEASEAAGERRASKATETAPTAELRLEIDCLHAAVVSLEAELDVRDRQIETAHKWVAFADREIADYRDRVAELEAELEAASTAQNTPAGGLLTRLRALF